MKVEIWSDFACPFCYIGKRHFEKALKNSGLEKNVEVEWKSFQLSPDTVSQPGKNIHQYLAERKGQTVEWAKEMNAHVTAMAADAGLNYKMNDVVIANTFGAHRLSQFAKKKGKQDEVEEKLFSAYFLGGKDLADRKVLEKIAVSAGLDAEETKQFLDSEEAVMDVEQDIREATQIGVRGVPFFVFNRKYAVSGAQPVETFVNTLRKVVQEESGAE
ncbi:MAG TPA: DsbA family oxidoreductase [Bacteroidia bacterium]|jgi:predicted DsbA family dithiol-disulfide isomerase|nr:DsbA family oxidoreductase [Bacteroidia bacterium]